MAKSCSSTREDTLGVKAGGTTDDRKITLEDVQCIAACTEAPCLQVNYRYRYKVTHAVLDQLVADLRAVGSPVRCPRTARLATVRQQIPADRWAGTGPAAQAEVDERFPT